MIRIICNAGKYCTQAYDCIVVGTMWKTLAWFGPDVIESNKTDELGASLSRLERVEEGSDFNRFFVENLQYLYRQSGKKVIFVFGRSHSDEKASTRYQHTLPYSDEDVKALGKQAWDELSIFSVYFGDDRFNFHRDLVPKIRHNMLRKLKSQHLNFTLYLLKIFHFWQFSLTFLTLIQICNLPAFDHKIYEFRRCQENTVKLYGI